MEQLPNQTRFTNGELETIMYLINFYMMHTPYRMVIKEVKEIESKVKGALYDGNNY